MISMYCINPPVFGFIAAVLVIMGLYLAFRILQVPYCIFISKSWPSIDGILLQGWKTIDPKIIQEEVASLGTAT